MRVNVSTAPDDGADVKVSDDFDVPDVGSLVALAETLCSLPGPVVLDFHSARVISDCALARLAEDVKRVHGRVVLVGLSEHHHRLLQLLGEESPSDRHEETDP